ncbi:PREDICTED: gamma-interferon-inducible lysosomal thiol reductase-like isoform X2 [Lupinus angustifolius]|uniref:gamma-interferon-inducible lysosomal thiol reductase-like isoform X2 n=1 Tax=Lupinus angustifolius TaxID=3871 RepID=UPI00092E862A|nr:PREDICTED: gamma-interferon-inducible lysosomal thiol reductase-like isoform X2 [Lupinus angustifolius]
MVSSSTNTVVSLSLLCYLSFFALFSSSQSQRVSLELYYESLCPYSANFIVNYLPKIFSNDLLPIVDLTLVPWGNAKLNGNSNFTCQHGPYECLLNTVEACAINIWPELNFPFIYCVETLVYERKQKEWESCFDKLGLDPKPIDQCYNGEYGKELELEYAAETNALQPPHKYVPWVVVDGEPLYEDYENFLSYVCNAYKGTDTPQSCTKASLNAVPKGDAKPKHSVSNMERMIPTWEKVRSTITSWMQKMNF